MTAKTQKPDTTHMSTRPYVIVDTNHFQNTHGRQPRGYGLWAFSMSTSNGLADEIAWTQDNPFMVTGTYTEAKTAAHREAVRIGANYIKVLS